MSSMAGLLQYYFFPTDFYYPRPQPVNNATTSQKQQPQSVVAVPAALQTQKQQDSADHQILENQEKPFNKIAIRCSNMQDIYKPVLKSSGAAATSTFPTVNTLRKPEKDLIRAVMFEDSGF